MWGRRIIDRERPGWTASRTAWRRCNWPPVDGGQAVNASASQEHSAYATAPASDGSGSDVATQAKRLDHGPQHSGTSRETAIDHCDSMPSNEPVSPGAGNATAYDKDDEIESAADVMEVGLASKLVSANRGPHLLNGFLSAPMHDLDHEACPAKFVESQPSLPGNDDRLFPKAVVFFSFAESLPPLPADDNGFAPPTPGSRRDSEPQKSDRHFHTADTEDADTSVLSAAQDHERDAINYTQARESNGKDKRAPSNRGSFSDILALRGAKHEKQWRSGRQGSSRGFLGLNIETRSGVYEVVLAKYCKAADKQDDWLLALNLLYTCSNIRNEFGGRFARAVRGLPFHFDLDDRTSRLGYIRWLHSFGVDLKHVEQILHEQEDDNDPGKARALKMTFRMWSVEIVTIEVFCKCREASIPCHTEQQFAGWLETSNGRVEGTDRAAMAVPKLIMADVLADFGGYFGSRASLSGFMVVQQPDQMLNIHDAEWVATGKIHGVVVSVLGRCTSR